MAVVATDATAMASDTDTVATNTADPDIGHRRLRFGIRAWRVDALVVGIFLFAGFLMTVRFWWSPASMVYTSNDEVVFEWMLGHAVHVLTRAENPLFSAHINVPDGVNLMANTSVLGIGVPLAPVTAVFGTRVAFLLGLSLSFAGTAIAWYVVLLRTIVKSRLAAFVAAAFCAFAPGMVSQASGHLNLVAQFVVPPIVWAVWRLGQPGHVVRTGVILGLLVTYQMFISEELLLFAAVAIGLFVVIYALADRAAARRRAGAFLKGIGISALVAGALLAYPLWFQFFGPQHYTGLPYDKDSYFMDIGAYGTYARQSLTGFSQVPGLLSPGATEENAFFGVALIALCVVISVWLWRSPVVKGLSITALVFAGLSLGPTLQLNGRLTGIPGPLRLISHIPLLDLAVPARFPLIVSVLIALLLALSIDRASAVGRVGDVPVRLIWVGAVLAVLLPAVPLPLRTFPTFPRPDFIISGQWKQFVGPGQTVIPVPPLVGSGAMVGMFWSARSVDTVPIPGGYFIGPRTPTDNTGRYGAFDRPTGTLLGRVADTGDVPVITDLDRQQAVTDLRYWHGAVVVLARVLHEPELHRTLDRLLGPGTQKGNCWIWDVRTIVG